MINALSVLWCSLCVVVCSLCCGVLSVLWCALCVVVCSLCCGVLSVLWCAQVGQKIEVRPGIVSKTSEGKIQCTPIRSLVISLFAESNELQYAVPGGLIGEVTVHHLWRMLGSCIVLTCGGIWSYSCSVSISTLIVIICIC